jgi:hypothetical protein
VTSIVSATPTTTVFFVGQTTLGVTSKMSSVRCTVILHADFVLLQLQRLLKRQRLESSSLS